MAFVSNNTSNQKDSNPQKNQKDEVAAQPTNNKESKPLKSFKKSSSNKSSKIKYVVLVVLLIVLSTAGVLYLMEEQKEAPVPTVPESEPEASSDSAPCTLSFSVPTPTSTPDPTSTPTPTPDPTPVPIYPQCHSIEMLDEQDRPIYEYDITPNLNVTLACLGNFSTQSGGVPIEWMEFRALKKEVCLPGEDCSIIEAEQVWISKNQGELSFNGNIATGYVAYTTEFGLYALQCRVCTTSIEDVCDGEWDDILNWPDGSDYEQEDDPSVCSQENQTEISVSDLPGMSRTEVIVTAPTGYTNIELRITTVDGEVLSFRDADVITSPTFQWLWSELEVNYEDIASVRFFIDADPSALGSGGLRCGTWTPTNQQPTPPTSTPTPRANLTLVPTTYEDPSPGGCMISECGDYRGIRCIGTESLVCIRDEDGICSWQCEPSNIR